MRRFSIYTIALIAAIYSFICGGSVCGAEETIVFLDDVKVVKAVNDIYSQYIDYPYGYSINFPAHMQVDTSLSAVRTVIWDQDTQIELYYDNFSGTVHTAGSYVQYSNRFKRNSRDCLVEKDKEIRVNGLKAFLLEWRREKIENLENDKNYYANVKIIKNQLEVYTIFIKSSKPLQDYMSLINSFKLLEKNGTARIQTTFQNVEKNLNEETHKFFNTYFLEGKSLKWGIFERTAYAGLTFLHELERELDYTFEFIVRYQNFGAPFPGAEMLGAWRDNKYVELTLQANSEDPGITYDILRGWYDGYLNQYARDIKEFGHPVLFRLNNEMNGDWCIYSSYYTSNDTDLYKAVWRYIYTIFQNNGVDNVLWVWNPHDISFPGFRWNHYLSYYPGDGYVDIIGLTGYNTGDYFSGERWRSFTEIYTPLYNEYNSLFKQPMMITEFGSNSAGGDKIAWIRNMFTNIEGLPNIKAAIWWNGVDYDGDGNPGRIYRLDETDETLAAFRQGLHKYN